MWIIHHWLSWSKISLCNVLFDGEIPLKSLLCRKPTDTPHYMAFNWPILFWKEFQLQKQFCKKGALSCMISVIWKEALYLCIHVDTAWKGPYP